MSTSNRIKCYYFFDKNQLVFKECFEQTMQFSMPNIELCPIEFIYKSDTSNFGTMHFRNLMLEKVTRVKDIIQSHIETNQTILISDIDIIIYKNFEHLLTLEDELDIKFQKESGRGDINTGFILLKCNYKTLKFWDDIEKGMNSVATDTFINEQAVVNNIISTSDIRWSLFPDSIWAYSNTAIPQTIHLHHANNTAVRNNKSSFELKCEQMIYFLQRSPLPIKMFVIQKLAPYCRKRRF